MLKKSFQYISILKNKRQAKLDCKEIVDKEIMNESNSTFILYDETMPKDVTFKINSLQEKTPFSYITSLITSTEQSVVKIEENIALEEDFVNAKLDEEFEIVVNKALIFEEEHFYDKTGIDYIYSTFHILMKYTEENRRINTLYSLNIDNKIYVLITDGAGKISHVTAREITSFDEVADSEFYENEIVKQKLFDEMYYLEFQNTLNEIIKEFYEKNSGVFLEKLDIVYNVKQLNPDEVESLKEELLMEVSYKSISIGDYLYSLAVEADFLQKSFIKPRVKSSKKSTLFWGVALLASFAIAGATVFLFQGSDEANNPQPVQQEIKEKRKAQIKNSTIKLPNHINNNRVIQKRLLDLFEVVPYNVLVKDIFVTKKDSIMVGDFLSIDTYMKSMHLKLMKLYETSEVRYKDESQTVIEGIITNKALIKEPVTKNKSLISPLYLDEGLITKKEAKKILRRLLNNDAIVSFKELKDNDDFMTYKFSANVIVKEPLEFFSIIENLNKELYSINIAYPVRLTKGDEGIEIDFKIEFNQFK